MSLFEKEEKTIFNIFSILKLGKSTYTKDERMLVITEEGVTYYRLISKFDEEFKEFRKLYNSLKSNIELTKADQINKFYDVNNSEIKNLYIKYKDKLDSKYKKDTIPIDNNFKYMSDDKIQNPKNFKKCVHIKSIEEDSKSDGLFIHKELDNSKKKEDKEVQSKLWIIDIRTDTYYNIFKSSIENIKRKKKEHLYSNLNNAYDNKVNKFNPNLLFSNKKEKNEKESKSFNQKNAQSNNKEIDQEPDILQQIYYNEMIYQYLISQYIYLNNTNRQHNNINVNNSYSNLTNNIEDNINNKNNVTNGNINLLNQYKSHTNIIEYKSSKLKLECSILYLYSKFIDICKLFVKKIILDLANKNLDNFSPTTTAIPIVFPNIKVLMTENNGVLLYYITGINFQLTWNQIILKIKDNVNQNNNHKYEGDNSLISGIWNNLKADFKNKDYANELIYKLNQYYIVQSDSPRIPMACLIDYLGFRVLCESDIYIDDGSDPCKNKVHEIINNTDNNIINDMRDIASVFSVDKLNYHHINISHNLNANTNIMNDNNAINNKNTTNTKDISNLDTFAAVNFVLKEKDKNDGVHSKLFGLLPNIKYVYNCFKTYENLIFNTVVLSALLKKDIDYYKQENREINDSNDNKNTSINSNSIDDNKEDDDNNDNKNSISKEENNSKDYTINNNDKDKKNNVNKIEKFLNYKSKFYQYFNYNLNNSNSSISIRDVYKDTVKYIMDTKVLIQIPKERIFEQSNNNYYNKLNNNTNKELYNNNNNSNYNISNFNKINANFNSHLYYKTEYILKYIKELNKKETIDNNNLNDKDTYIKMLKKYLFLDSENEQYHMLQLNNLNKNFIDYQLLYFLNALDSVYYSPYDSATLRNSMKQNGINTFFLGYIAENTKAPHVRELCLIEMISLVCKTLIFDIIAQKIMEKFYDNFYKGNNENKYSYDIVPKENTISTGPESSVSFIPVSFYIKYCGYYLKNLHILSNKSNIAYLDNSNLKSIKKNTNTKGLYKHLWHRSDQYNDNHIKKNFLGSKIDNKKNQSNLGNNSAINNEFNNFRSFNENYGNNTNNNISVQKDNLKSLEYEKLQDIKKEVCLFLNVLFNFSNKNQKYEVEIYKKKHKNISLWKNVIFEQMKLCFNLTNYEFLKLCSPVYISLPALLNSIKDNTGIVINLSLVNNTRFSNMELINRDFTEDMITDFKPIIYSYEFRSFEFNENNAYNSMNNFNFIYNEDEYNSILKKILINKVSGNDNKYDRIYMSYLNIIRKMQYTNKDVLYNYLNSLEKETKINLFNCSSDNYKNIFLNNSIEFYSIFYFLLYIIDLFSNYNSYYKIQNNLNNINNLENKNSIKNNDNNNTNFIVYKKEEEDYKILIQYISEFWHPQHPYISIINLYYARLKLRTKLLSSNESINEYYNLALYIANESLGKSSCLYVAGLCEEYSQYHIANENYLDAIKLLKQANMFYSQNVDELFECYTKNLKRIVKFSIVLGDYNNALNEGVNLINKYNQSLKKSIVDNFLDIEPILFNLINISIELEAWIIGSELSKILIFDFLFVYNNSNISLPKKQKLVNYFNLNNSNTNLIVNEGNQINEVLNLGVKNYKDYRVNYKSKSSILLNNLKNDIRTLVGNNEIVDNHVKIDIIMQAYLKCVIKSITGNLKKTYIMFILYFKEYAKSNNINLLISDEHNKLIYTIIKEVKEEGDLYKYIIKILNNLNTYLQSEKIKTSFKITYYLENNPDKNFIVYYNKILNLYKAFSDKNDVYSIFKD